MKKLDGIVTRADQSLVQYVVCEDAPEHLRYHILLGRQRAQDAKPGDRVTLEFKSTPSSGLWYATKV